MSNTHYPAGIELSFDVWYSLKVKVLSKKQDESQIQISSSDFLKSYNKNIPEDFPHASLALLKKFKDGHPLFFKHGDLWSLDEHRKKVMDWFQLIKGESA